MEEANETVLTNKGNGEEDPGLESRIREFDGRKASGTRGSKHNFAQTSILLCANKMALAPNTTKAEVTPESM